MRETIHRTCTLCEAMCGLTFDVEDRERIVGVRNDPDDPFSQGFCCPKGLASGDLHHDPDRLRRPLRRTKDGSFEETSWDEAIDLACEGLAGVVRRHGLHGLGVYVGNPVVHNLGAALGSELFRTLLPTHNRYSANSQDVNPHLVANYLMFGAQLSQPIPDLARTQYLLIVGGNPLVSNGSLMCAPGIGKRLRSIRARGGRVVVVDPRRTETARVASEHLFIRPGVDALLLLAMAGELFRADLLDRPFLQRWADGWEGIPELLAPFTPERVAPHLGPDLTAEVVRRLARELAEAQRGVAYCRIGVSNTATGGLATWAVNLLNVLTGSLDRPGGAMFPEGPASWIYREKQARGSYARYRSPQGFPEVAGEYPCHILAEQIERGREDPAAPEAMFGLVTFAGNPVLSAPNGRRIARALESLEFMVSLDIYRSETARFADVILPPRSGLHDPHFDAIFPHLAVEETARWSPAVLPAPADHPSEFELMTRLGRGIRRRSGLPGVGLGLLGGVIPWMTPERMAAFTIRFGSRGAGLNPFSGGLTRKRLAAEPHGLPTRPLEPRLRERILHRSGRIACAPAPIVSDLPRLVATLDAAPSDDGLVLIGRRHLKSNNSWFHNLPKLRRGNRCTLLIHPEDAAARGLTDGDLAELRSRVGAIEVPVELSDEMMRGVVSLPHGWGHQDHTGQVARGAPGVNVNDLSDDQLFDPLTGNAALNGVPVTVGVRVAAGVELEA